MQEIDQYAKQSHILLHFDIFIFENKVAGDKMQLNRQFALCPATMECPEYQRIKVDIDLGYCHHTGF